VLLGKPATLLGALSLSTGESACEILSLRRRRNCLRSGRRRLGPRCAHVRIVAHAPLTKPCPEPRPELRKSEARQENLV
jgi:hypothetical protein